MSRRRSLLPATGLGPMAFILVFGVVSGLADFVYEGARSVAGPYLATFGASAALVGLITGLGEAVALVLRLATGRWSDRTRRYWAISITGYAITLVSVPLLGVGGPLGLACLLFIAERFGKAVRTPARDTMLAAASSNLGRGRSFALHEALDQSGALVGPLVVAAVLALTGSYRIGFAALAVPGIAALAVLALLRLRVPRPEAYSATPAPARFDTVSVAGFGRRFWQYAIFTATTMAGFSTFAVLAYHLVVRHVLAAPLIPVLYALAMGSAAVGALASGHLYDRVGLRGLAALPVLAAVIPLLSFSLSVPLVCIGAAVWGAVTGMHESTMRAAVADLVPPIEGVPGTGLSVPSTAWHGWPVPP